jgi:hypothetical protein
MLTRALQTGGLCINPDRWLLVTGARSHQLENLERGSGATQVGALSSILTNPQSRAPSRTRQRADCAESNRRSQSFIKSTNAE